MPHLSALIVGVIFLAVVLLDAFQTIILPRRPAGRLRLTRLFFLGTWGPWTAFVHFFSSRRVRDQLFSAYGPLSLLMLMLFWVLLLIAAYALIFLGLGSPLHDAMQSHGLVGDFGRCLYLSGTTLFTLGMGDVTPVTHAARVLIVVECGTGLGFATLVIGYVPVLYGAFSRREVAIALLDARAGSPPTAGELLMRHDFEGGEAALRDLLAEWERWCAEMLESHISYPILCYYRSQHDNQSWLSSITAILDTCALMITTVETHSTRQAQLTFAIARHTLVDLGHVFHRDGRITELAAAGSVPGAHGRLPDEEFGRLCRVVGQSGLTLCSSNDTRERLASIRRLYEPQATALAEYLRMELPRWTPADPAPGKKPDQWTTVASLRATGNSGKGLGGHVSEQSAASRLHDDESHPL